jgi:hypothetical protein
MARNEKISELEMLSRFQVGAVLLPPLVVKSCVVRGGPKGKADARVELALPGEPAGFRFAVEVKARATPQAVRWAIAQAKSAAQDGEGPMIHVPFLSGERLEELEREQVSGVDLCGNGVVIVPGRLFVVRSGAPNRYRDSRPLSNPYRGRSAMAARMLLQCPRWESLSQLAAAIQARGAGLSLPQASKAVQAMEEDLIVSKSAGVITLGEPLRLLEKLGSEWRAPRAPARLALRLPDGTDLARCLSSNPTLQWAVTGESSVTRYAIFSQGGPHRIAVSSLPLARTLLGGLAEPVPHFADVELVETDEPGFFFGNAIDEEGIRWASRVQTWLELQAGDARQRDAARELRDQILKDAGATFAAVSRNQNGWEAQAGGGRWEDEDFHLIQETLAGWFG